MTFNKSINFGLSDVRAVENISMTLTELSVFMKKQELLLRMEKEKEEGEWWLTLVLHMHTHTLSI